MQNAGSGPGPHHPLWHHGKVGVSVVSQPSRARPPPSRLTSCVVPLVVMRHSLSSGYWDNLQDLYGTALSRPPPHTHAHVHTYTRTHTHTCTRAKASAHIPPPLQWECTLALAPWGLLVRTACCAAAPVLADQCGHRDVTLPPTRMFSYVLSRNIVCTFFFFFSNGTGCPCAWKWFGRGLRARGTMVHRYEVHVWPSVGL